MIQYDCTLTRCDGAINVRQLQQQPADNARAGLKQQQQRAHVLTWPLNKDEAAATEAAAGDGASEAASSLAATVSSAITSQDRFFRS